MSCVCSWVWDPTGSDAGVFLQTLALRKGRNVSTFQVFHDSQEAFASWEWHSLWRKANTSLSWQRGSTLPGLVSQAVFAVLLLLCV